MADEELIEKIEAWLSGALASEAAETFERQMRNDPALAEAVELHRLTLHATQRLSENALRQNVSTWLDEVHPYMPDIQPLAKPRFPRRWKWLVLSALLLVGAGMFGVYKWTVRQDVFRQKETESLRKRLEAQRFQLDSIKQKSSNRYLQQDSLREEIRQLEEQLRIRQIPQYPEKKSNRPIAGLYEKPVLIYTQRGADNAQLSILLEEGAQAFNAGNYIKAAANAGKVLEKTPAKAVAWQLLAHAHFNQKRYLEAIRDFEQLKISGESTFEDEADWHLLLCHLALSKVDDGEMETYRELLTKIANSDSKFARKARSLMER